MNLHEQVTQPTVPPYRKRRVKRQPVIQPEDPSIRYIPLTQGQVAIVDAEDYEWLSEFNWSALWYPSAKTFYAIRNRRKAEGPPKIISMHREIMKAAKDQEVDHNGCHNWHQNMRLVTHSQNQCNRIVKVATATGFKGVDFFKRYGKWRARIQANKKAYCLGYFGTAEAAHAAYVAAAKEKHGEFANWG